jgi:acyl-CoA synthetase (NDP forming)
VLRHLVDGGFTGSVVAVHPEVDSIEGVTCVRTLADAGGVADLAIVVVPAERVAAVIEDAATAGVHGVVVMSGGFGDSGPEGLAVQAELVGLVRRTGMRLVGPNALGLINTDPSVRLNASLVPRMPAAGRVGCFSQSGALGASILERLQRRGLGVSTFVSAGNRADISGNDLLQYWEDDDATDVVVLYLETIGNARKFARIVHRMSAVKPVAMVRMGGADQQHPLGHAAASTLLSQRAVDEILADCGLIVADGIDHLLDVARLAVGQPLPTGTGVAIVGNSDALSVMAVNALSRTHLTQARPPVVFARQESASAYQSAIRAAVEDPSVGAVLAVYVPPIEHPSDAAIRAALRECARDASAHGKPLVAVMLSESERPSPDDIPAFPDVDAAVQALSLVARYSQWRRRDASRRDAGSSSNDPGPGAARPPVILHRGSHTRDAAAEALSSTGLLPLTMRTSETGIVGCRIRLVTDPLFGPVVSVGVDDPVAEALDDRSYRLAPVTPTAAMEMVMALGSIAVLRTWDWGDEELLDMATAVASVSRMPAVVHGLESVDLRHAAMRQKSVTVSDVSLTVSDEVVPPDAPARRL